MIIKMHSKISFHSYIVFVLFITLSFFGAAFLFSVASPPAYGQTVNAWNLHRQGANDLNFYYNNGVNQPIALQLNTNGEMRARKIWDYDTGQTSYFIDPGNTGTSLGVAGSVGIGTTAPTAKFNISGAHTDTLAIMHSSGAGTGGAAEADLAFWASEPGCTYQGVGIGNNVRNYTGVSTGGNICYPRISTARGGSYIHFYDSTMEFRTVTSAGADAPGLALNTTGVGIGVISPFQPLHIKGGNGPAATSGSYSSQTGAVAITNSSSTNTLFIGTNAASPYGGWLQVADSNSLAVNYPLLLNPNGGNIGMGTANPNGKLDIYNSGANGDGAVFAPDLTLDNTFTIQSYIDANVGGGWANRGTYATRCCNNLALQPDVGTVSIGKGGGGLSGNYGLTKLNVMSEDNTETTNIAAFYPNNMSVGIGIGYYNVRQITAGQPIYLNAGTSGMVHVGNVSSGGVSLAIGGGNVGVGTTTPQGKFAVGAGNGDQLITYQPADDQLALQTTLNGVGNTGYGGDANILALQPVAGRVGIGTTAPSARFMVGGGAAGTARFDGGVGINGYQPAACGAGFGLCVGGSSGGQSIWNNTSDVRLKENITTIPNALEKVIALRGVYFDFKDMEGVYNTLPKNRQVGFIAQEVEPILPEVVTTGSDGMKMLGYGSINALLTEAIKEQQKQIEAEKARNDQQQQEIELLKQEIELLKNK